MYQHLHQHRLILGGARSGKSGFALAEAEKVGAKRLYLATATALDGEMSSRILAHQAERGEGWTTVEEPLDIAGQLARDHGADVVLLDCLTLWLSNLMHERRNLESEMEGLIAALVDTPQPVILVSNEVGLSLVPETALGRAFRDAQGLLNQRIAASVARVDFVAAGLPLRLKP